jgi:hypothetical protein
VTSFLVTLPCVPLVQLLAASGVDGLIIELEHGPIDIGTAQAMIAATLATHKTRLVGGGWPVSVGGGNYDAKTDRRMRLREHSIRVQ